MNYRLILTILFGFAYMTLLHAQPRYDIGFHGGALVSTMPGFSNSGFSKVSGTGGMVFTRRDKYKNHLQMEVNYIRKGALRMREADNPDRISLSLHYVEIPVFYRMDNLAIARKGRGGFDLGLSYAYLVSPQLRRNGNSIAYDRRWSDSYDLSALFGVHYRISSHLYIDARYSFSINPILRRNILPDDIAKFNSQQTHNHVIQVGLSFYLRGRYY